MAKRLRGVQLQAAMGLPGTATLEEGRESNLATALLSLWAHGHLSATQIQKLAHAAILDGSQHPELSDLAKAGNFGAVPGNIHRDISCRFVKNLCVPEPADEQVACIDPKSGKKELVQASTFLPHMMFSELSKLPNFHEIFPFEKVQQFWADVERSKDPRLDQHPCKSRNWKKLTMPIWLHAVKACWCFANEDMVAKISQLVFSISPGVRSTKLSKKMGPKYRILLHLLLTREGFSLHGDET